jgi:hypothetical protein
MRRLSPAVLLAFLGLALAGCAGGDGKGSATHRNDLPPPVVAIDRTALAGVDLRNGARFVSPSRLAIVTWGSGSCPAVPDRLVVQSPNTIRIHLALGTYRPVGSSHRARLVTPAPRHTICTADLTTTPMVLAIDEKRIDVNHRLTVYLYYYDSKKPLVRYAPPLYTP